MAQASRVLSALVNGTTYTAALNAVLEALDTANSGTTAPADDLLEGKFWLDTSVSPAVLKIFTNGDWEQIEFASTSETRDDNLRAELKRIPGEVQAFAMTTAPAGWLKCNGADVSRTEYADLFAAIGTTFGAGDGSTTFKLPDLRGEFVRGWDDGRGADNGRSLGSAQTDLIESHSHTVDPPSATTSSNGSHTHGPGAGTFMRHGAGGPFGFDAGNSYNPIDVINNTASAGAHTHTLNIPAFNSGSSGGSETRPRNVALLYCIKF